MSGAATVPIRAHLRSAAPYTPVKPLDVLARELGIAVDDLVKLDANENPFGVLPEIRAAMAAADHNIYPDPAQTAFREAVGSYLDVAPALIVGGLGSDELIDLLIRVIDTPSVVTASPTFGMYSFLAGVSGIGLVDVPRTPAPDFELDLPGIAAAVDGGARLVFIPSPNNPTGRVITHSEFEALAALDAVIVVDEAYAEFSGVSVVGEVAARPNIVVMRTFSKWAGLAGVRVGYIVAPPELVNVLNTVRQPYNLSTAAQAAAIAAIEHRGVLTEQVTMLCAERDRIIEAVAGLGWLNACPSDANFVLCQVVGRDAAAVVAALRAQGILVRYYNTPELRNYIRISAGTPSDTDRLLAALQSLPSTEEKS